MKIDNLKEVLNNYKYLNQLKEIDIFSNNIKEDATILALNQLELYDKALLLLYIEFGSYRKVALELNVSHQLIKLEICRIKEIMKNNITKILEEYDN